MRRALHMTYFTARPVVEGVIDRNSTYQLGTAVGQSPTALLPRATPRWVSVTESWKAFNAFFFPRDHEERYFHFILHFQCTARDGSDRNPEIRLLDIEISVRSQAVFSHHELGMEAVRPSHSMKR